MNPPGNRKDIESFYRQYVTMVRGCAQRIVRDEAAAEDIVQEVFLRFIKHRDRGDEERATAAYLYRMTSNLALNYVRDRKHRAQLLDRNRPYETAAEDKPIDAMTARDVLAQVTDEEAQIATYYYVEGLEQHEIAALLQMQRRTVGRRLERFRAQAQAWLFAKGQKESD